MIERDETWLIIVVHLLMLKNGILTASVDPDYILQNIVADKEPVL